MSYTYSIAVDFNGELNSSQLHREITENATITTSLIGVLVAEDNVRILFTSNLSSEEQTALNTVVANHVPIVVEVASYYVSKVLEENVATGENFLAETLEFNCATGPDVTTCFTYTWPYSISMKNLMYISEEVHRGDVANSIVAENTIIGYLTQACPTGSTELHVSQTVIDNVMIGYYVNLFTGLTSQSLNRVLGINKTTNVITVETETNKYYTSYPLTYVRMSIYHVKNYIIGPPGRYEVGTRKFKGSHLPPNVPIRIYYTNKSAQAKTLYVQIEYFY